MTAEQLTALASIGTFVVITATALAAFIQLRLVGTSNALTVLNQVRTEYEAIRGPAAAAMPTIFARLNTPEGRAEVAIRNPEWMEDAGALFRLFEGLGGYAVLDIVPREAVCGLWSSIVIRWWQESEPIIAVLRRREGNDLFENWEALVVYCEDWIATNPSSYPRKLRHKVVNDAWADLDAPIRGDR